MFLVRALLGFVVAAALLSPSVRAQDVSKVIGTYCLTGVREMGSCMRLSPGGKFEYFLAYGAYNEQSEGTWKLAKDEIIVDSLPYDRRPTFGFNRVQKGDAFDVIVESTTGRELAGIDVRVTCDGTTKDAGQTQESRFKVDCMSAPTAIALGLRMFGLAYQTIDVANRAGGEKIYVFEFDPGDLGKRKFVGQRLQAGADGALVTVFDDTPIAELKGRKLRYERER